MSDTHTKITEDMLIEAINRLAKYSPKQMKLYLYPHEIKAFSASDWWKGIKPMVVEVKPIK